MVEAEGSPDESLHLGVEGHPVSGVPPRVRDADGGALPRIAPVPALEEPDVRVRYVHVCVVVGIEVHAIARCDIQTQRAPLVLADLCRVDLPPRLPAVDGPASPECVGEIADLAV